jgi:hypothetical protein
MAYMLGRRFETLFAPVIIMAAFASSSQAQPSVDAAGRERSAMAQAFSQERLSIWKKRLKLDDWNITVQMARTTELKARTLGNIHWDSDAKTAAIRVLDPADYTLPEDAMLKDMEFTVIHELIHLKLAPLLSALPRSEASRRDEEHTVNNLADALLGR